MLHTLAPDPLATLILALAVILVGAKIGGDLAERIGQPAVLGELLAGIVLGNLDLFGIDWFRVVARDATVNALAGLGAVLLLFEVGLESTVQDMMRVGWRGETRVRRPLFYLRLKNNKIWIEEDWTKEGIAHELVLAGVPHADIVLAFQPPAMRSETEFAAA